MNVEKHVKSPLEEWLFADSSPVPGKARSARIVGHYIKDKKRRYTKGHPGVVKPAPILLRLEGLPGDPATRERIERQIREANRQWRLANLPLRAKLL